MINLVFTIFFQITSAYSQVDVNAFESVKELHHRLKEAGNSVQNDQYIFLGQQNAYTEGRGFRFDNSNLGSDLTSDMQKVAQFRPSVFGVDFAEIGSWNKDFIIEKIKQVHELGGFTTISWHMKTLVDDGRGNGSYNDTSARVVNRLFPGQSHHEKFKQELDRLAEFLISLGDVPIVFRPWHEHNESWFWWGKKHCTVNEYKRLWQLTFNYLHSKNVHNLLWAYSPNHITSDYFERYPGNEYVDILGVDFYFRNFVADIYMSGPAPQMHWKKSVIWLMKAAETREKIAAITEFGQESVRYDNFWTDYFAWPIQKDGILQLISRAELPTTGISYIMLWRNDKTDPKHYYGPIPGHKLNNNFQEMLKKNVFIGL